MKSLSQNNLNIPKEEADRLAANWQDAFPGDLSRFFSFPSGKGRQRYDTFKMSNASVNKIVNELNSSPATNLNDNILSISILMGVDDQISPFIFQPILQINLVNPVAGSDVYYFTFIAEQEIFVIPSHKIYPFLLGQISAAIAELFILNWQSLPEDAFISAFETTTTDKISTPNYQNEILSIQSPPPYIEFGSLKLYRVKSYHYSIEQTQTLIAALKDSINNYDYTDFYFHAGYGLPNINLHPFAFRPILDIKSIGLPGEPTKVKNTYFDTSRPCPPFCPDAVWVTQTPDQ